MSKIKPIIVQVDATMRYKHNGDNVCAVGAILPTRKVKTMKKLEGNHSCNFAETAAILHALRTLDTLNTENKEKEMLPSTYIVETDSQVSWGWIVKDWKIHDNVLEREKIVMMIAECKTLLDKNTNTLLRKISRKHNMSDLSKVDETTIAGLEVFTP